MIAGGAQSRSPGRLGDASFALWGCQVSIHGYQVSSLRHVVLGPSGFYRRYRRISGSIRRNLGWRFFARPKSEWLPRRLIGGGHCGTVRFEHGPLYECPTIHPVHRKYYAVTADQSASATPRRRALRNRVHTASAFLINRPNAGWRCQQRAAGHSWRSARIGSTLVARSAGIRLASTATTIRNSAAPAMLTGSAGLTW